MCHKLLQVYACGHLKTVCTTPCPHAIATGRQIPQDSVEQELSRSNSITSSLAPSNASPVWWTDLQNLPSQRQSQAQTPNTPTRPSPLRIASPPAQKPRTGPPAAPPFHFVTPGQPFPSPPPGYPLISPTTSPSPTSPSSSPSSTAGLNDAFPAPTSANPPSRPTHPMASTFTAHSEIDATTVDPNFCAYHFPRYLPQNRAPCLACYSQPEWERDRDRWMGAYRETHPGVNTEHLEGLTGIKRIREGFGG
ncbi:hypothetical protein EJ02DRAFT_458503 [Clathrospora elynae]|uniref:Uncharacterized protein n=1 Tax=Clathrospora elynae TaxID=706981 RepID=A0A6A5SCM9_9PLEO|nr:hypothetical protein EJ02DRAFT_458503 [Clathrospora elynae]